MQPSVSCIMFGRVVIRLLTDTCCSINATKLQRDDRFRTIKYSALIRNTINSLGLVSMASMSVSLGNFS